MRRFFAFCLLWQLLSLNSIVNAQVNKSPVEDSLSSRKTDTLESQAVYRFDANFRKTDLVLTTASAMVLTGLSFYDTDNNRLELADLDGLDKNEVPAFDRDAIRNYDLKAQDLSDYLLIGSILTPLIPSLAIPKETINKLNNVYLFTQTLLITNTMNLVAKVTTQRKRPYVYNENVSMSQRTSSDATASFYSGHTAISASMMFLTGKMLYDYYPDSKPVKYAAWPICVGIPAYMGFLRVQAGKHYPSDVIIGYAIGAATGFAVPWVHHYKREKEREERKIRRKLRSDARFSVNPMLGLSGASGVGMSVIF